jgi:o-succinylbenzoate synthase
VVSRLDPVSDPQAFPGDPMIIERVEARPYRLLLRRPWRSSKGELHVRCGWLVRLWTADGSIGYGDCAPLPQHGTETLEAAGERLSAQLVNLAGWEVREALTSLDPPARGAPAARCGIETALLDLLGQGNGRSLAQQLGRTPRSRVPVNAALGALGPDSGQRIRLAAGNGYRVVKLKVGLRPLAQELACLEALADGIPPGVRIRLDGNGRWTESEAGRFLAAVRDLPVESLEEPVAQPSAAGLKRLQALVPWPLALDESLPQWNLRRLLDDPPVRRIVLKPMVQGGLLPALALAGPARDVGVEVLVTTTFDSAVGVWAALHLALVVGGRVPHGLGTCCWLAEDVGEGPPLADGYMTCPLRPGLGFVPAAGMPGGCTPWSGRF